MGNWLDMRHLWLKYKGKFIWGNEGSCPGYGGHQPSKIYTRYEGSFPGYRGHEEATQFHYGFVTMGIKQWTVEWYCPNPFRVLNIYHWPSKRFPTALEKLPNLSHRKQYSAKRITWNCASNNYSEFRKLGNWNHGGANGDEEEEPQHLKEDPCGNWV